MIKNNKIVILYFFIGAITFALLSIPQRIILGIEYFRITGYVLPAIFGGSFSALIGYFYLRYKNAIESKIALTKVNEEKLTKINQNLEIKVKERTTNLEKINSQLQELITKEKESKDRYRKLVNSFNDLYFETNNEGIITFVTPSCFQFGGYSQEELIGKKATDIYQNPQEKIGLLQTLKSDGHISDYTITILGKNGNDIVSSLNAKNMIDDSGNIIGTVGTLRDDRERQKVEHELRKMQIAVEQNPASIVITDINGNIEYVNHKFEEITGYSFEEVIGKNPNILKTDYHSDEFYKELWETISSGEIWTGEFYNKKKNGEFYWESVIISPIIDQDGNIKEYLAIKEDISALKDSQAKYKGIVTAAHDAIVLMNNAGNTYMWNPAAEKMFGYSKDEILGKDLHQIIVPEKYLNTFKQAFVHFKSTGKGNAIGKTLELDGLKKDGTEFPCELTLSSIKLQGKWNAIGIIRDISERKKKEDQIKNERDKAQLYLDISGVFFVEIDNYGTIVLINKKGCELLGFNRDDIIGKNWFDDFIPKQISDNIKSAINESIDSGKDFDEYLENPVITSNGEERLISWHNSTLKNIQGEITGFLSAGMDITDMKMMEEDLKKHLDDLAIQNQMVEEQGFKINQANEQLLVSQEELKELNATKDKFFSIIAHDLKNPIGASKQLMDIIADDYDDLEETERKEIINEIAKATNNTYELLLQLLDWSRSQRGKIDFNPDKIDASYITKNNIDLFKTAANNKEITLVNDIPVNTFVYADANMLTTIIRNLLSNSIKFTPNKGQIIVSSEPSSDENFIELSVSDNGVGISEENLKRLFKLDTSNSTLGTNNEKGTGLGLILVKEFIEKNGGNIWVESEEQKGSKFIFTMPKAQ